MWCHVCAAMSSIELAGLSHRIRSVRRSLRTQVDESQGSWSGLSASCVRQALLVYLWSQAKTSHHALDAAATYLARAAPLVIVQVAVSAKDAFDALFAATSAALMARLSTDPPASELYRACDFIIQYPASWLGQVSKCRVWSGPQKAAVSKTGFALCSGRPSRGCREPPVFAYPWWPSIPTDIFETFSESLERAHRHLTCHSLFANPCVAGEGVELVGLGRFGTQFWKQFWIPNLRSPWLR